MCPIPGAIPTATTPISSGVDRITRFLSSGYAESSRRLIAYRSSMVLLIGWCALTAVICYQGMHFHQIDGGLLSAWTLLAGIIATLAKLIFYRKPDEAEAPQ